MMIYRLISEEELQHHGIKGQKWGIRRYQNADGTLTPEGIARKKKMERLANDERLSKKERKAAEYGAADAKGKTAIITKNAAVKVLTKEAITKGRNYMIKDLLESANMDASKVTQNTSAVDAGKKLAISFATVAAFEYVSKERAVSKLDKKYD